MRTSRSVRIDELKELAAAHPQKVGKYDAKKQELKTPDGAVLSVEAGQVGRSEKVYVKGQVRKFLAGLDLPELQPAAKEKARGRGPTTAKKVSLKVVPPRQSTAYRSWGAWFKVNPLADPENVCDAVRKGYATAEEEIRKAKDALEQARQKVLMTAAVKALRNLRKSMTAEQLAELLKKV